MPRPEHRSRDALLLAHSTGKVNSNDVAFLRREAARRTNDNRALMAATALLLSRKISLDEYEQQPSILTMGYEFGSWLYGWWTLGALAAAWHVSPGARRRLRAEVEWARLTARPVTLIKLITPDRVQVRRKLRAPKRLVASIASRYLWSTDLNDYRWQPELAIQPRLRARGWLRTTNDELRWAGRLLLDIKPSITTQPGRLLPLVKGHRIELRRYADNSVVVTSNRATHRTRGPVSLAMIRNKQLTLVTSSQPVGSGEWSGSEVISVANGIATVARVTYNPRRISRRIDIPLPPNELHCTVWTDQGVEI